MDPSSNLSVLLRLKNNKTKKWLTGVRRKLRDPKLVKIKFKTFWMKLWMVKPHKYKLQNQWSNLQNQVSRKINSMEEIKVPQSLHPKKMIAQINQHSYNRKNKKNLRQMLQVIQQKYQRIAKPVQNLPLKEIVLKMQIQMQPLKKLLLKLKKLKMHENTNMMMV